ncbi:MULTISPECIES: gluconokinase [Shewanella]|uniref:Gluconokinase n=1 Tax=Shewanella japonica TaxID=93973 RepID=A0ABN4YD06_9GAMM|nr:MULTISPECIES: gluconokinase [Shewanella]ARD20594.1 gluconokinase [Shewanella japonica]KPZ69419.1 Thermoresistant gluconokinase [Shewanella sp. P1-14-1]MBQ4890175.1 gluconokinase [Shewanella sp. MMG014]OBT05352.1 gluconate kinase [Shewanella sp. UCD-FRSSP16_17]
MTGKTIIVMGVCACGKSTVGEKLANSLNAKFIDGDDLHPRANIQKMARGEPLNDDDRAPWLERVRDAAYSIESKNETAIIVCSALKQQYRDTIREGNQQVAFLYLQGSYDLILARMQARSGHFMKQNMVDSQFATLEDPSQENLVVTVNVDNSIDNIVSLAVKQFKQLGY